jgi:hypothetical protein
MAQIRERQQYPVMAFLLQIRAFLSVSRRKISLLGNERSLNRPAPAEGANNILANKAPL